jgi:predicted DNA-binding protein (MmcQ/YjbR family)
MEGAFERIQAHCLAKPGAFEDYPWGETVWKVGGKMFGAFGSEGLGVKSTLEKQAALIQHPNIEVAAYVGKHGWVTVYVRDEDTLELALELIDESYDLVVAGLPKSKRPATK